MTANKSLKRSYIYLAFIIAINSILKRYISGYLPFVINASPDNLFLPELLRLTVTSNTLIYFISDILNIILVFVIAEKLLGSKYAILTTLLYALAPIVLYMGLFESIYLIGLLGINLLVLGLLYLRKGVPKGYYLVISAMLVMLMVNISMLVVAVLITLLYIFNSEVKKGQTRKLIGILLIFASVVLLIYVYNPSSVVTEVIKMNPLSEIGLVNNINQFQGEQMKEGVIGYARLIDNRYTYYARHLLFSILDHVSPVIYFAPQIKMFGFSFAPPVLTGVIIPFLVGVYFALRKLKKRSFLFILFFIVLAIPSILTERSPNVEELLLVVPFITLIASYGFMKARVKKNLWLNTLMIFSAIVVIGQFLFFVVDIAYREYSRYLVVFG